MREQSELLELIAQKVGESNLLATSLAREMMKHPELLKTVVESLDPKLIGKEIAMQMGHYMNTRQQGSPANDSIRQRAILITQEADREAARLLAQHISEEIRTA